MWGRVGLLVLVLLSLAPAKPAKPKPVEIKVLYGTVLPHKGTVTLRITVEPDKANRGLWRAVEATGYAGASFEQLDGNKAPKTRQVEFKDLPDGVYTAWARLLRDGKPAVSASATFIVGASEELFQ